MIPPDARPYDVAVAYRVYPKVSKSAQSLPFGDDKGLMAETCLKSFKDSLGSLRVKFWAILDGCPQEYEEFFRKHVDSADLVILKPNGEGNGATFSRQLDILLQQNDSDIVYFAEDDYFYLPNQFHLMIEFLRTQSDADFVSPYDHLDCYTLALHRGPKWLRVYGSHHWRTAASTCLTFLTSKETLRKHEGIFRSYTRGNSLFRTRSVFLEDSGKSLGVWLAPDSVRQKGEVVGADSWSRDSPGYQFLFSKRGLAGVATARI
jgi:hypothetical protein